jgi:hypothetical protein
MNIFILTADAFNDIEHVSNKIVGVFTTKELAEKEMDTCKKYIDDDPWDISITYTIIECPLQGV